MRCVHPNLGKFPRPRGPGLTDSEESKDSRKTRNQKSSTNIADTPSRPPACARRNTTALNLHRDCVRARVKNFLKSRKRRGRCPANVARDRRREVRLFRCWNTSLCTHAQTQPSMRRLEEEKIVGDGEERARNIEEKAEALSRSELYPRIWEHTGGEQQRRETAILYAIPKCKRSPWSWVCARKHFSQTRGSCSHS